MGRGNVRENIAAPPIRWPRRGYDPTAGKASRLARRADAILPSGKYRQGGRVASNAPATMDAPVARPMSATETIVARAWAEELRLPAVGLDEDFIDLGSHSLQGVAVAARLEQVFGITIPVRVLFEEPTVVDLAAWIDHRRAERGGEWTPIRLQHGSSPRKIFAAPDNISFVAGHSADDEIVRRIQRIAVRLQLAPSISLMIRELHGRTSDHPLYSPGCLRFHRSLCPNKGERIERIVRTEEEWKRQLGPQRFEILRREGTEPAFGRSTGTIMNQGPELCGGCALPLFSSEDKFDSGTGWPASPVRSGKRRWRAIPTIPMACIGTGSGAPVVAGTSDTFHHMVPRPPRHPTRMNSGFVGFRPLVSNHVEQHIGNIAQIVEAPVLPARWSSRMSNQSLGPRMGGSATNAAG